ncbi:TAXI family TRAP transporter solute-binding subunit [Verticiella sediminum]
MSIRYKRFREQAGIYGSAIVLSVAALALAIWWIEPAPPSSIRLATGAAGGAYAAWGEQYKQILEAQGIRVELQETSGAVDNLRRLADGEADVAFLQAGLPLSDGERGVQALASIGPEPSWIFVRPGIETLRDAEGRTIAGGAAGSGTLAFSRGLVELTGLGRNGTTVLPMGGEQAVAALQSDSVDTTIFVSNAVTSPIERLLRDPEVRLLSVDDAAGLISANPWLTKSTLFRGSIDYRDTIPARDITLLSTTGLLAAGSHLHPAFVDVLLSAAITIHASPGLFTQIGEYPQRPRAQQLPANANALRYFEDGPTFLRRYLPFWVASFVERGWILIFPLLTVMFPLFKIAPPTYRWQIKRRINRYYLELQKIEMELDASPDPAKAQALRRRTQEIDANAARTSVPLVYMDDLYHLRRHIHILQMKIAERMAGEAR